MKKWIFIVIGILIVGFVGYQFIHSRSNNQQSAATQVRTATVQKGQFQVNVSGTGTVQPVTSEDIKSSVNNNSIAEVLVSAGETVKKGADLITFTDGSDPITAPADGTITTLAVSAGEHVQAGETVAHLTNYSNLDTLVSIDELDIPNVKDGQTATIKVDAFPNQTFTGKVTGIASEGTSTNGVSSFNVTVSIDNPQNLKVGMSTQANILTASKDNVLYVPLEAVHTMNNEKYVILDDGNSSQNGSMQRQTVQTGLANDNNVEITSGLTEGETVRLPSLAVNTTSTSGNGSKGMFGGGMGGFGGGGGGMRYGGGGGGFGGGGNGGGGGGGGRSGN